MLLALGACNVNVATGARYTTSTDGRVLEVSPRLLFFCRETLDRREVRLVELAPDWLHGSAARCGLRPDDIKRLLREAGGCPARALLLLAQSTPNGPTVLIEGGTLSGSNLVDDFSWADPDDNSQLLFDALSFALKPAPVIRQDVETPSGLVAKERLRSRAAARTLPRLQPCRCGSHLRDAPPRPVPHRRGRRSGWASRRFFALPKAARSTTLCLSRRSARRPHASLSRS